MKRRLALSAGFSLLLIVGLAWTGMHRLLPVGPWRDGVVIVLGVLFAATFVGLLVSALRQAMAGESGLWRNLSMLAGDLLVLLIGFALIHQRIGLLDNTASGSPVVHEFWISFYYSVVTFTTLGYGDFYPTGVGRVLAAVQALTGYLILGILASTAASMLSPYSPAGTGARQDREADESDQAR